MKARPVTLALMVTLAVVVCSAAFGQTRAKPSRRKALAEYKKKSQELDEKHVRERIELASWCVERGLLTVARFQLRIAAAVDPRNDALLPVWQGIAEKSPRKKLTLRVVMQDGSVVRGVATQKPFLLRHASGILFLPLQDIRSLTRLSASRDKTTVRITTPVGTFEGKLVASPIVLKTTLGEFQISLEKMRSFSIGGKEVTTAPPRKTAKPGEAVSLEWNDHVAQLREKGLDVVFVFDATGSMGGVIFEVKSRIETLMGVVKSLVPEVRVGLVAYRDHRKYDRDDFEFVLKYQALVSSNSLGIKKLQRFLRTTEAYGGGDVPEAVYAGVKAAMDKSRWNSKSKKVIIVFGDAPPHPQNDGLRKLYRLCSSWHKRTGGVVSTIDTRGRAKVMAEFESMAENGGGESSSLENERAIIKQLVIHIFGTKWKKEVQKAMAGLGPE